MGSLKMTSYIRTLKNSYVVYFVSIIFLVFSAQESHGLRGLDRGHYDLEYQRPLNYGTLFWRPQDETREKESDEVEITNEKQTNKQEAPPVVYRRPYSIYSSWSGRKRDGNTHRGLNPLGGLSILDNIATLRKSLLRELAARSMARKRAEMLVQSENYKDKVGRKR